MLKFFFFFSLSFLKTKSQNGVSLGTSKVFVVCFVFLRSECFVLPVNVVFCLISVTFCFHVSVAGSVPEGAQHLE